MRLPRPACPLIVTPGCVVASHRPVSAARYCALVIAWTRTGRPHMGSTVSRSKRMPNRLGEQRAWLIRGRTVMLGRADQAPKSEAQR
jgi:hypothetical protein